MPYNKQREMIAGQLVMWATEKKVLAPWYVALFYSCY